MNETHTTENSSNPTIDAFNYLLALAQDYVNTLPVSSKIAVAKEAQAAFESYKQLIDKCSYLEEQINNAKESNNE